MVRCRRARNQKATTHRALALLAVLALACGEDEPTPQLSEPSFSAFVGDAYPILLRDCGFPACPGDTRRFFQVYGPGRTRLSSATLPYDAPTTDEQQLSYDRARSMLSGADSDRLLLLRKPLAEAAGGTRHAGDDPWQQPIYRTATDPSFLALRAWALAAQPASMPDGGQP